MSSSDFRRTLLHLHEQLGSLESVHEQDQEILRRVRDDIQGLLDRKKDAREGGQGKKILDSVRELEIRHPALTDAINRVAETLSDLGI